MLFITVVNMKKRCSKKEYSVNKKYYIDYKQYILYNKNQTKIFYKKIKCSEKEEYSNSP